MKLTIAIDPGVRAVGLAIFAGGELHRAQLIGPFTGGQSEASLQLADSLRFIKYAPEPTRVSSIEIIGELPQVRQAGKQKGDQADILAVAFALGAYMAALNAFSLARYPCPVTTRTIAPRDWKGTVNPDVMLERIESKMKLDETHALMPCRKDLRHNMIDAVGIGLWSLGRLSKTRVFGGVQNLYVTTDRARPFDDGEVG